LGHETARRLAQAFAPRPCTQLAAEFTAACSAHGAIPAERRLNGQPWTGLLLLAAVACICNERVTERHTRDTARMLNRTCTPPCAGCHEHAPVTTHERYRPPFVISSSLMRTRARMKRVPFALLHFASVALAAAIVLGPRAGLAQTAAAVRPGLPATDPNGESVQLPSDSDRIAAQFGKGVTFQSKGGDFHLQLRGRVQVRFGSELPEGGEATNEMIIRRARLALSGRFFDAWELYVQLGLSNQDN